MRPFFKLLLLTVFVLASLSAWVKYRQELAGTIQTLQIPAPDTPTGSPNATPTHTPTPEPTGVDVTAPQILAIDLPAANLDTTAAAQLLTVTVHITDDLSGLARATLRFVPASGGTQFAVIELTERHRVSGDRRDGVYVASGLVPKYAAHGRWYLSEVMAVDNANNAYYGTLGSGVAEPVPAGVALPPYFVNGEDDSALPGPVETVEPGPLPPEGEVARDGAGENELRLPLVRD